jgi:hypothetical protein
MQEDFVMAEEPIRQHSYLSFIFSALGIRYTFLLPLAGLIAFVVVLFLVLKGKGHALPAALMLIVPLPVLVGFVGVIDGMMASFTVIAMSDTAPKPSAMAEGVAMSLVTAWVGMLLAIPSYLLATIGMCIRSLQSERQGPHDRPLSATLVDSKP